MGPQTLQEAQSGGSVNLAKQIAFTANIHQMPDIMPKHSYYSYRPDGVFQHWYEDGKQRVTRMIDTMPVITNNIDTETKLGESSFA